MQIINLRTVLFPQTKPHIIIHHARHQGFSKELLVLHGENNWLNF
jgi:hypothetical protein